MGQQSIAIGCHRSLGLGEDSLQLCGHRRYRENVESPSTNARIVGLHPPAEEAVVLPIGHRRGLTVDIPREVIFLRLWREIMHFSDEYLKACLR